MNGRAGGDFSGEKSGDPSGKDRQLAGILGRIARAGLTSPRALSILRAMKGMDFTGMDVVDVSPPFDHAERASTAAAIIAVEMLCLKAWARGAG